MKKKPLGRCPVCLGVQPLCESCKKGKEKVQELEEEIKSLKFHEELKRRKKY